MKAEIIVTPKQSVYDPQGDAVKRAIHHLGVENVESVRIGKFIELEISGKNVEKTREKLDQISKDLLSNPVIEDYIIKFAEAKAPVSAAAKLKALIEEATEDDDEIPLPASKSKAKSKDKAKDKSDKKKSKKEKKKDKKKKDKKKKKH